MRGSIRLRTASKESLRYHGTVMTRPCSERIISFKCSDKAQRNKQANPKYNYKHGVPHIYIYIYIYTHTYVCVCVCYATTHSPKQYNIATYSAAAWTTMIFSGRSVSSGCRWRCFHVNDICLEMAFPVVTGHLCCQTTLVSFRDGYASQVLLYW